LRHRQTKTTRQPKRDLEKEEEEIGGVGGQTQRDEG